MKALVCTLTIFCVWFSIHAQEQQSLSPIIFIYDASGSMWGQINGRSKIEIASTVLSATVNNLPDNQKIGLVAYGHRVEGDCKDVEFIVDVENGNKSLVNQALKQIKPLGKTPLAFSARLVIDKLRELKNKATIILITDGIESCDGNICDEVKAAREEGIDFKMHIVGFGLKPEETEQLECAAEMGDGNYFNAANANDLNGVLKEATSKTVDLPDNFSIVALKNNIPIDALVHVYNVGTDKVVGSVRTYRDTGFLNLPAGTFDIKIIPLENSKVNPITLSDIENTEDRIDHKTVYFDAGKIQVSTLNNKEGWDATVKIIEKTSGNVAARGRTYGNPKVLEVNPGIYDVELQALVIEGLDTKHTIEKVEVLAGKTIEIAHSFSTGIAMIGAKSASGLVDATVNFYEINSNKNVAAARTYTSESSNPRKFLLNPGTYRVVVMALGDFNGQKETITITVNANETVNKTITFQN